MKRFYLLLIPALLLATPRPSTILMIVCVVTEGHSNASSTNENPFDSPAHSDIRGAFDARKAALTCG